MSVISIFSRIGRRQLLPAWALLAALPVGYVAMQVVASSRNFVYWDEFDTALDLVLRIDAGAGWRELLQRFFALNNEHRMLTSRLLFAASYWLTGTLNFHVLGAIGNLFLVGTCALLIASARGGERPVRLAVILAFLMFQLGHFENLLWSGASIDHFQVVMLAVGAVVGLACGTRSGAMVAGLCGFLATFTLAHGILVWPVGALLLWSQRRWKQLAGWAAFALLALAAFFPGFEFNPAHDVTDLAAANLARVARYWLALLGAPLALGDATLGPVIGAVLLAGFGVAASRGAISREPVAMFTAAFALAALGLIAVGRAGIAGSEINSRYMVLGALAWAMLLYVLVELGTRPGRPFRLLAWTVPGLVAFNIASNIHFLPHVEAFTEMRDRAATRFKQYGSDGHGISRLHPRDGHADVLLAMAAERRVYDLPRLSHPATFRRASPSTRMITYVDELLAGPRAVTIGGWAMIPGKTSQRGQVHVVLQSEKATLFFTSLTLPRRDVARAYEEPRWRLSGFRAVIDREDLPAEDFAVGVLIAEGVEVELTMTENRLLLRSDPGSPVRHVPAP
jgi:hypothetical protein